MLRQDSHQSAIRLFNNRNQQVVNRDEAVAESVVSDVSGLMQNVVNARCEVYLTLRNSNSGRGRNRTDQTQDVLSQTLNVNTKVTQQDDRSATLHIKQSIEEMLNIPLRLLTLHDEHLGSLDGFQCLVCEIVSRYRHVMVSDSCNCVSR